jgi:hypothetical protein
MSARSGTVEGIDIDPTLSFTSPKNIENGTVQFEPRENHTAVVHDGKMFIFGGKNTVNNVSTGFFFFFLLYFIILFRERRLY